jgi:hypothetical protein
VSLGDARQLVQHFEIARDDRVHAGPQHLDHYFAGLGAVQCHLGTQFRRVHLRDRSRGERLLVEADEHLLDRTAVGRFDEGARHLAIERRDAVLQPRQFVGYVEWQQIAARGQRLAELHEDGAELLERQPQPFAAWRVLDALEPGPRAEQEQEAQWPVQVSGAHEFVEPVAHEDALDFDEPGKDAEFHVLLVSSASGVSRRRARASRRSRSSRSFSTPR